MTESGRRHYCVFGCSISGAYMHAFPHPVRRPEMHKTWVSIVGDKLKGLDPWKIYKNKKICTFHFRPNQKVACHRLIYNAVPCINLSGKVALAAGPLLVLTEHNYSLLGINGSTISSSEQNSREVTFNEDVVLHVFPNPVKFPDNFKVWVHLVGGKLESSSDFEYYKKKRICDIHFTNEHRNRFKRLNALAVPSLYLPNTSGTQQVDRNNQPEATVDIEPTASVPVTALLGGSNNTASVATFCRMEHNYSVMSCSRRRSLVQDATVADRSHRGEDETAVEMEDQDDISMYHDDDPIYETTVLDTDQCYSCNECKETITGFRYTCVQCADWDLCGACEARAAHAAHYVLRIPRAKPYNEINAALAVIRRQMLSGGPLPDINDREDVKSELEEPPEIDELDPLADYNEGDGAIDTDIIPHIISDAELPTPSKRPRLGSSHCSEPDLITSPENLSSPNKTVAHDNSSPNNNYSKKSVEDIDGRKLANDKPSIPISKLIRQSETSPQATGGIPILKPIAEASVPLEMRVIKQRAVAGNPPSRLRQEKPVKSPSEDNLTPQGTDRSTAKTTEVAATAKIIPDLERTATTKASSSQILRVPIGTNRAVVKALKSKVSVRLKRIDVSKWKCKS